MFSKTCIKRKYFPLILECFPLGERSSVRGNRYGKECQFWCPNPGVAPLHRLTRTTLRKQALQHKCPFPTFPTPGSLCFPYSAESGLVVRFCPHQSPGAGTSVVLPQLFPSPLCVYWGWVGEGARREDIVNLLRKPRDETRSQSSQVQRTSVQTSQSLILGQGLDNFKMLVFIYLLSTSQSFQESLYSYLIWSS